MPRLRFTLIAGGIPPSRIIPATAHFAWAAQKRPGAQVRAPRHGRGQDRYPHRGEKGLAQELLEERGEKLLTEMSNDQLLPFVALDVKSAKATMQAAPAWSASR
jgi:hypothetical protein